MTNKKYFAIAVQPPCPETCKLNGIDPQRYLHYILERIADHPINRVHELLPWNVVTQLNQPAAVPEAMAA